MNSIISIILIAVAIFFLVAAFVLRIIKLKTIGNWLELLAIASFIAFASQYAYLFGKIPSLSQHEVALLLLYVFSILLGVYKLIFLTLLQKR